MTDSNLIVFIGASISILAVGIVLGILFIQKRKESVAPVASLQQALLESQLEIHEKIFHEISDEIHNNIGQLLSLVKLNLNTLGKELPEKTSEKIQSSKDMVGKAITDLRDLSRDLDGGGIITPGLTSAIERETSLFSKKAKCKAMLSFDGRPFRFDRGKEVIFFRLFQEALNTVDQNEAKTVFIRLAYQTRMVNLTISDDKAFDAFQKNPSEGNAGPAVLNMQNRAHLIGADFRIITAPIKGTSISLDLTLENNN